MPIIAGADHLLVAKTVYRIYVWSVLGRRLNGGNVIKLQLNQQQLELMDRTIARGVAPDRVALVRLAVREYAAARQAEAKAKPNDLEPQR